MGYNHCTLAPSHPTTSVCSYRPDFLTAKEAEVGHPDLLFQEALGAES